MKLEHIAESMIVAENLHDTNLKMLGKPIEFKDIINRLKLNPIDNYKGFTKGSNIQLRLSLCGYGVSLSPNNSLEVIYEGSRPIVIKTFVDPRIKPIYNKLAKEIQSRRRYSKRQV